MSDAPCENTFERWSHEDPTRLVAYISSGEPQHLLTFAAEIAGRNLPTDLVKGPLIGLLSHPSSVVREGAVYGLSGHLSDPDVLARVAALSVDDSSPGVREAAAETVEGAS